MSRSFPANGGRFATLIDDDGNPPCDPADGCPACLLFAPQRPDESRADWLSRITGYAPFAHQEAS